VAYKKGKNNRRVAYKKGENNRRVAYKKGENNRRVAYKKGKKPISGLEVSICESYLEIPNNCKKVSREMFCCAMKCANQFFRNLAKIFFGSFLSFCCWEFDYFRYC